APPKRQRGGGDDRARRDGPGPDPAAARGSAWSAWAVADPHHPRSVSHSRDVRPGPDHVRRAGGGGGERREGIPPTAPPVHPEVAGCLPEYPRRPADARGDPWLTAGPAEPASRLPLRATLLVRDGR